MALPPLPSESDWALEIAEEAAEEFDGVISVLSPGEPTPYDPVTDTGGESVATEVLKERPARIQHIRLPLERDSSGQWSTQRRYRFQIDLHAGDPVLSAGMTVRVDDGGRDPALERLSFSVISATNSSSAAVRTIETISELAPS